MTVEDSEEDALKPRAYQQQLTEIALQQNTIVFLPTGTGKTFIAVMVLKHFGPTLEIPYSQDGGKIAIMLVNTVSLVDQQSKYLRRHTYFDVGAYTGEMNVDFWDDQAWKTEFNKNQVLVMTAQILVNILNSGYITLNKVSLIVFDECHQAVVDHPMRAVMKNFERTVDKPRVLGLTASILNGNVKIDNIEKELLNLETTFHAKIASVDAMEEVLGFKTNPKEIVKQFLPNRLSDVEFKAKAMIDKYIEILNVYKVPAKAPNKLLGENKNLEPLNKEKNNKDLINMLYDLIIHFDMCGIYGGSLACEVYILQFEQLKLNCDDAGLYSILSGIISMISLIKKSFIRTMDGLEEKDKIYNFSSKKILCLLNLLKDFKKVSKQDLCCIVFVERKYTARIVYHILYKASQVIEELTFLEPNYVIGFNNNPFVQTREGPFRAKKHRQVLNEFCSKKFNLLVSTNVIEEGVDIPTCTCIIKFDFPKDYRSYIQSKGRARHKNSYYYIMVDENSYNKFLQKYAIFLRTEMKIIECLVGNNDREDISDEMINKMYREHLLPPYVVNNSMVDMTSATSLLSIYCSILPSDIFTTYTPEWYLEKNGKKCKVYIQLPIVCPIIEPIAGPFMPNKKLAKRAAALYACIALHKAGELNDQLIPIKRTTVDPSTKYLFEFWPEDRKKGDGNTKKFRRYTKSLVNCLQGRIQPNTEVYVHIIDLTPKFCGDNMHKMMLQDFIANDLCYAFITVKPFVKICDFPVYLTAGEINAGVRVNAFKLTLTEEQISILSSFHDLVFYNVLNIIKQFLVLNSVDSDSNILIAPVYKSMLKIAFDIVEEYKVVYDQKAEPSVNDRRNMVVNNETHLGKIVTPWYRSDDTIYLVNKVMPDMNSNSNFPNNEFPSFTAYFKSKYGYQVINPNLPLILVHRISKKRNSLKPRASKGKKKRGEFEEEFEEYIPPELCVKQNFPGCLWVQALLLPSIFFRVNNLAGMEEFRQKIGREGAIGRVLLEEGEDWETMKIDPTIAEKHFKKPDNIQDKSKENEEENVKKLELSEALASLMQECKAEISDKIMEVQYPWKEDEEPIDMDRVLNATPLELEVYHRFVSQEMEEADRKIIMKKPAKSNQLQLTFHPEFVSKPIHLLEKTACLRGPQLAEIYRALTAIHCNEIVNFERLETLGDSFLKYFSSLYVMLKFPKFNEGQATMLKSKLVSNRNLYYAALNKNISGYLQFSEFQPDTEWLAPGYTLPKILKDRILKEELQTSSLYFFDVKEEERVSGTLGQDTIDYMSTEKFDDLDERGGNTFCAFLGQHSLPDKTVADGVEAMLGAYFQAGGIEGGLKFMEWMGLFPKTENICKMLSMDIPNPVLDADATQSKIDFHIPSWKIIEKSLGYSFKNRAYLLQALTHASYTPNRVTSCYQRLEFLGDAVLDFLITCHIYETCGNLTPGELTDLRSALVNNITFACYTVKHGFHKSILAMNMKLENAIDRFVEYHENKNYAIDDDVIILLNEDDIHLAECIDVPKALGDVFEALAGAVFLDSGMNLHTVWDVFYKIIWQEVKAFSANVPKNAIRQLFETIGAHPKFHGPEELDCGKIMVALDFMVNGAKKRIHGLGDNKKLAKKAAAKVALKLLA